MLFSVYPYHNFSDYNLDWCIETVKKLLAEIEPMKEWQEQHQAEYEELLKLYNNITSGNLPDAMYTSLMSWIERNGMDIIGNLIKSVFFGLTDSGYFTAYIPETWDDLTFNTTDYDIFIEQFPEYGHLTISY